MILIFTAIVALVEELNRVRKHRDKKNGTPRRGLVVSRTRARVRVQDRVQVRGRARVRVSVGVAK